MGLAVFISGTGSNFKAIHRACLSGRLPLPITLVVSNKADAPGLDYARAEQLPVLYYDSDDALLTACAAHGVTWLILAGYMKRISNAILAAYSNRVVNIHPSLLPKYKGLNAQQQALDAGDSETGCTVHYAVPEIDSGPIIRQARVPIYPADTLATLKARLLPVEHETYCQALESIL